MSMKVAASHPKVAHGQRYSMLDARCLMPFGAAAQKAFTRQSDFVFTESEIHDSSENEEMRK